MSLLSRVYAWSIILEPLLFFVVAERAVVGVSGNIFKILQLIVILWLSIYFFAKISRSLRFSSINLKNHLYVNYYAYVVLLFLSSLIGFFFGSYTLPAPYQATPEQSYFSRVINSAEVRPIFEFFIVLYYFFYFVVLPSRLLTRSAHLDYFFSRFKFVYLCSFTAGVLDYLFDYFGVHLIPRHISDWVHVGLRFHGLSGEPRDAFVYLFLGLAVFHLHAFTKGQSLNRSWIAAVVAAAILTQSASGLLGIVSFVLLYFFYSLSQASIRKFFSTFIVCLLILFLLYMVASHSDRILKYLAGAAGVWDVLESGGGLPYGMNEQRDNIFPLYDFVVKLREFDFWGAFFGFGVGSASVINNLYNPSTAAMANPHSQFVRIIYESGVVGAFFFLLAFIYPVKTLTESVPSKKRSGFILLTLLLFSCFMAHRSAASFIYLGILMATFRVGVFKSSVISARLH